MPENSEPRVAVYLDFDNIVISRYDQVHGRGQFMRDRPRMAEAARGDDPEINEKLRFATVDIGAVIDFAASFGTLVLTRAYADWSAPVNADYRQQLVARAIDLVQLFPAAAYAKNGADIRLAVDAVEDMFRLPDLTHVVIVAGDSDYIALAQRCKRLGRYVIGVGVAGSTSKALAAACDEFDTYDSLPGVLPLERVTVRAATESAPAKQATRRGSGKTPAPKTAEKKAAEADSEAVTSPTVEATAPPTASSRGAQNKRIAEASIEAALDAVTQRTGDDAPAEDPQDAATNLLERALQLGHGKDDGDWLHSSAVKTHMKRMDPSFSEKSLGFRSFSDFVKAREGIAELEETGHERLVRLRQR